MPQAQSAIRAVANLCAFGLGRGHFYAARKRYVSWRTDGAVERGVSQRRTCALMSAARSGLHYALRMPAKDAPVVHAMRELSSRYPRLGALRIRVFLGCEGMHIGKERCSRLWAEAGLEVHARKRRRRPVALRQPRPQSPSQRNAVWSYNFVYDACANGQKLKCLTVVDEYTQKCLAIDVAGSIRSQRVIDVLSRLISLHGAPAYLRIDNVLRTKASTDDEQQHPMHKTTDFVQ